MAKKEICDEIGILQYCFASLDQFGSGTGQVFSKRIKTPPQMRIRIFEVQMA